MRTGYVRVQICSLCWFQDQGRTKPTRLAHSQMERCFDCDGPTNSGIYVTRKDREVGWLE